MFEKIKAVIFDIDGTLYDFNTAHKKALHESALFCCERFGWTVSYALRRIEESRIAVENDLGFHNADIHDRMLRFQRLLEEEGQPIQYTRDLYHVYWDTLMARMKAEPGVMDWIRQLSRQGIKLGIATDMLAYRQYQKLELLCVMPYLDFIVTSEEAGYEKPHEAVFQLCLRKAGCLPEECLMVGDTLKKDITGAIHAGMKAIWYVPGTWDDQVQEKLQEAGLDRFGPERLLCLKDYRELL